MMSWLSGEFFHKLGEEGVVLHILCQSLLPNDIKYVYVHLLMRVVI